MVDALRVVWTLLTAYVYATDPPKEPTTTIEVREQEVKK